MAIRYRAWSFDPRAFHRWLDPQLFVEGDFSPLLLRDVAMEVASNDDPTVVEYLECFGLRHDDEEAWANAFYELEPEDYPDWYVYSMAGHLTPCPRPSIESYWRLNALLPLSGNSWSAYTASNLLCGYPLRSLVEDYGEAHLHRAVGSELREPLMSLGGGWLPAEAVQRHRRTLEETTSEFIPQDRVAAFEESVAEFKAMLDAAVERGAALRMAIAT